MAARFKSAPGQAAVRVSLLRSLRGRSLRPRAGLLDRGAESGGELLRLALTPIVKKYDWRLGSRHVVMNRDDVDAARSERFQYECHFAIEHGDIPRHNSVAVAPIEGDPGVETHACVDGRAH